MAAPTTSKRIVEFLRAESLISPAALGGRLSRKRTPRIRMRVARRGQRRRDVTDTWDSTSLEQLDHVHRRNVRLT